MEYTYSSWDRFKLNEWMNDSYSVRWKMFTWKCKGYYHLQKKKCDFIPFQFLILVSFLYFIYYYSILLLFFISNSSQLFSIRLHLSTFSHFAQNENDFALTFDALSHFLIENSGRYPFFSGKIMRTEYEI